MAFSGIVKSSRNLREPSFEALVASDWCPHSLVDLLAGGDVELVEGEHDPLQVLAVLHPVDEVATHDVALQISSQMQISGTVIGNVGTSTINPTKVSCSIRNE